MGAKKPTVLSQGLRTMLRQVSGRYASKFTPGGREKRGRRHRSVKATALNGERAATGGLKQPRKALRSAEL